MNAEMKLPLVYACSGASSAAQMANHIAVKLDRLRVAEMSCIAGLGGDVKPFVNTARSGRPIIALDGCPLRCAAKILQRHSLKADQHVDLSEWGVRKREHEDFEPDEAARMLQRLLDAPDFPGRHKPVADSSVLPSPGGGITEAVELPGCSSPPCYLPEFTD